MRLKYTLQTAALSLGLGLSLLPLAVHAQAVGTPIRVSGTNFIPTSGTTISTVTDGNQAVSMSNGGILFGANGWTLSTSGASAVGVRVDGTSAFSGTNLDISTAGINASGMYAVNSSTLTLTGVTIITTGSGGTGVYSNIGSTITLTGGTVVTQNDNANGLQAASNSSLSAFGINVSTSGTNAYALAATIGGSINVTGGTLTTTDITSGGIFVRQNGAATLADATVNVAGALVVSTGIDGGTNAVVLDNVRGTNGTNLLNLNNTTTAQTTNLTIQNSALSGNLATAGVSTGNVNLVSGMLTGAANKTGASSALNVSVDGASKWIVNASSTLTSLTNQGVVDMRGGSKQMSVTDFTQAAGATLAMTLSGTGGVPNQLVNVNGHLTLDGALVLNGNAGAAVLDADVGGYFVLFNKAGSLPVSGTFSDIWLNGVNFGPIADGGSFTDANGYTYTLTYQGDAATGALTGGNDVLLHVVPEPGTWAMLVGGLGLLLCGQRLRRRSRS